MKSKPLIIGKIEIKNPILLAPMVDVTDSAYRQICKESGAELVYTEMLYVDAIVNENSKTKKLMHFTEKERPIGIQITGSKLEHFKKAIPIFKKYNYDLIDINCGCPSSRIIGNEAGSFLLKSPEKIAEIIYLLKNAGFTVTAKIRLGFKNNNVIETAKAIELAGADALTIHARLASDGNDIPADWKEIENVKKILKIPVIGNGDINSGKQAEEMLKIADGCMIAREAIGNPLIFKQIKNYLETGKELKINQKENIKLFKRYIELAEKEKIEDLGRIKNLGTKFISGFPGSSKLRQEFMKLKTIGEIKKFLERI